MSLDIVILEDEEEVAVTLREMVEELGHRAVGTHAEADSALEHIRREDPDLLLLDLLLEGPMNGIEAMKQLRQWSSIPVLFVTGVENRQFEQEMNTFPDCPVLYKPITIEELDSSLEDALNDQHPSTTGERSITALLVEDDDGDARLIERYVEDIHSWDIQLIHTQDPGAALERLQNDPPDVVLLDYYLGTTTGISFLEEMRADSIEVPTIVLTGRGDEALASKVLRAGSDDYRPKSEVTSADLVQSIHYVLRKHRHEQRLRDQARSDDLTGLHNRHYLMDRFDRELSRAVRYDHEVHFVLVDIDQFKPINDKHGHLAGDHVLETVGNLVEETIRESDVAGRYGGDEIALLLPETDSEGAHVMAHRIKERVEEHSFEPDDETTISISTSIGLAGFDGTKHERRPEQAREDLMERADQSLYEAKRRGRGRVERRKHPRQDGRDRPVTISTNNLTREGRLVDLSEKGARVILKEPVPDDVESVRINFHDREERTTEADIRWQNERDVNQGACEIGLKGSMPVGQLNFVPETTDTGN